MINSFPSLLYLQSYMANAIKNLGGLGFKAWMPFAFQTDHRIWKSDGRIAVPNTEIVSANGHRIGRDGLLNDAIANRLRISRGLSAPTQIGALVETARTNICLRSEELDNTGPWTTIRVTVTANDITAPDGTSTADKIFEDSSSSTTHHLNQSISWVSGNAYAISFYAKADERDEIRLRIQDAAFGANTTVFFNLATGTVGTIGASIDDAYMNPVRGAPGWIRCVAIGTAIATTSADIEIYLTSGSEVFSYTGDGSSGAHVWGMHVEIASNDSASSYIKTLGSTVTRAAEDIRYDNTGGVLVEATNGTIMLIVNPDFNPSQMLTRILGVRIAGGAGVLFQTDNIGDKYQFRVADTGSTTINSTTLIQRGVPVLLAGRWENNNMSLLVNAVQEATSGAQVSPTGIKATVDVGSSTGGSGFNGTISHILTFNRFLTDRQIRDVAKNWIQPIYPGRLQLAA